jgi:hypothetical protein
VVRRMRQICVRGKVGQRPVPLLLHVSLISLVSMVLIIRCCIYCGILDLRFTQE